MNPHAIGVAHVDLVSGLQGWPRLGDSHLKRRESALRVVVLNAKAEVVEPRALSRFEGVNPQETALHRGDERLSLHTV